MRTLVKSWAVFFGLTLPLCAQAATPSGKVLVILPSVDYLSLQGGSTHPTGYFLSELATPVRFLRQLDYQIVMATPGGVAPVMDPISDDPKWFSSPQEYQAAKDFAQSEVNHHQLVLETLSNRDLSTFAAVFVPGGHAALEDFPSNKEVGRILTYFHQRSLPTALICHGPAAFLSTTPKTGEKWIYSGYQMTVFSTAEEQIEETSGALGGKVLFYVQDALTQLGGLVSVASPWTSHVVRDRELITGQNPMSDVELAKALIQALTEHRLAAMSSRPWDGSPLSLTQGNVLVDVLDQTTAVQNKSQGYITVFIGTRKDGITFDQFSALLVGHISLCNHRFGPLGLNGYWVVASGDYEIAYQTWTSKKDADDAFVAISDEISKNAGAFMDGVIFQQVDQIPWASSRQ